MRENLVYQTFNRGIVSKRALSRSDVDRVRLSASIQDNFLPRVWGSMMLRPGFQYISGSDNNNKAYGIPFVYSSSDTAAFEMTANKMRIRVGDVLVSRPSVSTTITSGDMSGATGWTDNDQAGTTSAFSGGYMTLLGTGFNAARRTQSVSIAGGDVNVEHGLRVVVNRGEVILRVGTTSGADDVVQAVLLTEGEYSISFTPTTSTVHVDFRSFTTYTSRIDSCTIEAAGVVSIATPYTLLDLPNIRYDQSGNVVFAFTKGLAPYKIQRIDTGTLSNTKRSFGFVKYLPLDGPFRLINTTATTISASALTGDVTLTASQPIFRSTNVGSLYRIASIGQDVTASIGAEDQFSGFVRVVGTTTAERTISVIISGTWSGTVTVQRSLAEPGSWTDVLSYTGNVSTTYADGLANQIAFYRIGIKAGNYTSGTAEVRLVSSQGSILGIVRITSFSSTTSVTASVLSPLGGTSASTSWEEGDWSDRRGYPSACFIYEGRLWSAGRSKLQSTASDTFETYDDQIEGDGGPVTRTIGRGPVDEINWLLGLQRLAVGTASAEVVVRSSSLDEPLTPSNANLKETSNQGSSNVQPIKVDNVGMFAGKSNDAIFQTNYAADADDFRTEELSVLCQDLFSSGIARMFVQRSPDTRIHIILNSGVCVVMVYDRFEDVQAFVTISTEGDIEDGYVLPTLDGEDVYYWIKRVVNGNTVRYLEKWSKEYDCIGATYVYDGASVNDVDLSFGSIPKYRDGRIVTVYDEDGDKVENLTVTDGAVTLTTASGYAKITPSVFKLSDSHVYYNGTASATISGLSHLEGKTVVAFADGKDMGEFTVSSGSITLPYAVQTAVVGLPYKARFRSVKIYPADRSGTAMNQPKIVNRIGVALCDTHARGLRYGSDFDNLDDLPLVEDYDTVDSNFIWDEYAGEYIEFDGIWSGDSRVCLEAASPNPCNLTALVVSVRMNEKNSRDSVSAI